jgi:hypothetical protein
LTSDDDGVLEAAGGKLADRWASTAGSAHRD